MKSFETRTMLLCLFAAVSLTVTAVYAQGSVPPSAAAVRAWGFDRSDLRPHPDVRFGVLANGMRYAVMPNALPAGGLAVRLRFEAGADVEGPAERGFMHVLEHLVFHGTEHMPEGTLPVLLAPHGLRSGRDMSAYTDHDETVYRLDLGEAGPAARAAALLVMREIATGLRFSRGAVAGARDKVRDEILARDAVQDRIATAQNVFFMPGTALANGPVVGTPASVSRATGLALQRLYQRHYVPYQATLVIVGEFDAAAVEQEIAGRFGDWAASSAPLVAGQARDFPATGKGAARFFVDRLAPTTVTIASVEPLGPAPDGGKVRDNHFLEHLGGQMLNRRLAGIAVAPQAPFLKGEHAAYNHFSTARFVRVELAARDRDWRRALAAGAAELRRVLQQGFTQKELDGQLDLSRASLAAAAAPRTSTALADAITDAVHRRIIFTAAADPSASAAYLGRIRLADVNAAFRALWQDVEPQIFVSHNRPVPGGEAAIAALWSRAMETPLRASSGGLAKRP